MDIEDHIWFSMAFISFLISLTTYFRKCIPFYLKCFPPFLGVTIVIEYLLIREAITYKNNQDLYNISSVITFTFNLFILWQVAYSKKFKRIILFSALLYPVLATINLGVIQGVRKFSSINFDLGSILIIAFVVAYFYELYLFPRYARLSAQPDFWICTGLLVFYGTTFPIFAVTNFVTYFPSIFLNVMWQILELASYLILCFFSIAFICAIKSYKKGTVEST
jgi:hypothetical protein